jgi:tetratricopeptide (TPR) repeat protein
MRRGELQVAADLLRRTLELAPNDAEAANNLGTVEMRRKDFNGAIDALRVAITLNPSLIKAHANLSQAYQRAGRAEDARREAAEAAKLTEEQRRRGRAMILVQSAKQDMQSGRSDPALARLREATMTDPGLPDSYMLLGRLLRESGGDFEQSIRTFRHVIRLDPESAEAHYEIGLTLERAGRVSEAVEEFRRATEMAPCRVEMLEAYGRAAVRSHQLPVAAKQFRAVLAWKPNDREALDAIARAGKSDAP